MAAGRYWSRSRFYRFFRPSVQREISKMSESSHRYQHPVWLHNLRVMCPQRPRRGQNDGDWFRSGVAHRLIEICIGACWDHGPHMWLDLMAIEHGWFFARCRVKPGDFLTEPEGSPNGNPFSIVRIKVLKQLTKCEHLWRPGLRRKHRCQDDEQTYANRTPPKSRTLAKTVAPRRSHSSAVH